MKKIIASILAVALAFAMSACGENPDTPSNDTSNTENDTTDTSANVDTGNVTEPSDDTTTDTGDSTDNSTTYSVSLNNGVTLEIGAAADDVISALGEPLDYMEAPSCVHEGFDRVYIFDGYSVSTSPDVNGNNYISELAILSDSVAFSNGFTIGSMAEDAQDMFGEDFAELFGVRTYTLGAVTVSIIVDGDTVSGITISANRQS